MRGAIAEAHVCRDWRTIQWERPASLSAMVLLVWVAMGGLAGGRPVSGGGTGCPAAGRGRGKDRGRRTLTLLTDSRQSYRVRLAWIDAPERRQDVGRRAKQSLAGLAYRRRAVGEVRGLDRYGRVLGTVWGNGQDLNLEQVRREMAWVFRRYTEDPQDLAAEAEARQARRGLWSQADPVPPWEFRRSRRSDGR